MATSGGVISQFFVTLGIDLDETGLKKVLDRFGDLKDSIGAIGKGAGLGLLLEQVNKVTHSIVEATRATAQWSTDLERTARRSGIDADVLQRLNILEQENNMEVGSLAGAMEEIFSKQMKARSGQGYDEGFLRAGIGLGGDPAEVLERIIERGAGRSKEYQKWLADLTGVDMSVFELQGSDIRKIGKEKLFSEEERKRLIDVNKEFGKLNAGWDIMKKKLTVLVMPFVEKLLKFANEYLKKVLDYIKKIQGNEELMKKLESWLTNIVTIVGTLSLAMLPAIISALWKIGAILTSWIFGPLLKILKIFKWINMEIALITGKRATTWIADYIKQVMDATGVTKAWTVASNFCKKALKGVASAVWAVTKALTKMLWTIGKFLIVVGAVALLIGIFVDLVNVATGGNAEIMRWLENMTEGVPVVGGFFKLLRESVEGFWQSAKEFFGALWDLAIGLGEIIGKVLGNVWDSFVNFCSNCLDYFLKKFEPIKEFMKKLGFTFNEIESNKNNMSSIKDIGNSYVVQRYMPQLAPSQQYMTSNRRSEEQNYEFNNYNTFEILGEDAEENALVIGRHLGGSQYKAYVEGLDRAGKGYGNTGRYNNQ